jgi:hypothetical protein
MAGTGIGSPMTLLNLTLQKPGYIHTAVYGAWA